MKALLLGKREYKASDGTPLTEIFLLDIENDLFGTFSMKRTEYNLVGFEEASSRDVYDVETEQTKNGFNTRTIIRTAHLSGEKAKLTID